MIKEEGNAAVGIDNAMIIQLIIGLIILTISEVWSWTLLLS